LSQTLYPVANWNKIIKNFNVTSSPGAFKSISNGGYAIVGAEYSSAMPYITNPILFRLNSNCDTTWSRIFTSFSAAYFNDFVELPTGNFACVGSSNDSILLAFFSQNGDLQSFRQNLYGTNCQANQIVLFSNGLLISAYRSLNRLSTSYTSSILFRTNLTGDTIWSKTFFTDRLTVINQMNVTTDSNIFISGVISDSSLTVFKGWSCVLDKNGTILSSHAFGDTGNSSITKSIPLQTGGYLAVGRANYNSTSSKIWLLRMTSTGDTLWTKQFYPSANSNGVDIANIKSNLFALFGKMDTNSVFSTIDSSGDTLSSLVFKAVWPCSFQTTSDSSFALLYYPGNPLKTLSLLGLTLYHPPAISSAIASDNVIAAQGIDIDDYVLLSFSNAQALKSPVFQPVLSVNSSTINSIYQLSNSHSWLSQSSMLGSLQWNPDSSSLSVFFSTVGGKPSISVGDTITFSPTHQKIPLTGSFDPSATLPFSKRHTGPASFSTRHSLAGQIILDIHLNNMEPACFSIFNTEGVLLKRFVISSQQLDYSVLIDSRIGAGVLFVKCSSEHLNVARRITNSY
jgi:hypothetical protein